MMMYVDEFLKNISPGKACNVLYKKKRILGITNILRITELCIVMPLSNAEVEYSPYFGEYFVSNGHL